MIELTYSTLGIDDKRFGTEVKSTPCIIGFYGWLRLLTWEQLTDSSLNILFTKTTTYCEAMEVIR